MYWHLLSVKAAGLPEKSGKFLESNQGPLSTKIARLTTSPPLRPFWHYEHEKLDGNELERVDDESTIGRETIKLLFINLEQKTDNFLLGAKRRSSIKKESRRNETMMGGFLGFYRNLT